MKTMESIFERSGANDVVCVTSNGLTNYVTVGYLAALCKEENVEINGNTITKYRIRDKKVVDEQLLATLEKSCQTTPEWISAIENNPNHMASSDDYMISLDDWAIKRTVCDYCEIPEAEDACNAAYDFASNFGENVETINVIHK